VSDNRDRVHLADEVGPDRAPYEAALLKEAGARSVSRDSRARWFGSSRDPVVAAWLAAQRQIRQQAREAARDG
jgi:hypothetical protein